MENNYYNPKPIEQLTFTDNGMFQAVLHEPDICAELVERLLHIPVGHVEYPELEKQIKPYYTTKGVRLDVYLKDSDRIIDIEMQSYQQKALGKRTRYYQSMIDIDAIMKGEPYKNLKESYILFICKTDPFIDDNQNNYGLPCYTFKNICMENSDVDLDDKSIKVIYNASAYEQEKNDRIRKFLKYVSTNEPGEDDFTKRLSATVEMIKENDKFRSDYAAMNLHDYDITTMAKEAGIEEGREQGRAEGIEEARIESAKNLIRMEVNTHEQIAKATNLPLKKVQELAEEIATEKNQKTE